MNISTSGYNELTKEQLDAQIKTQESDVKTQSKATIINRWFSGRLLTAEQLKVIRSQIANPKSIKSIEVRQIVTDKKTGDYIGFKTVTKFFNKAVVRTDNALTAGTLPEELVINANEAAAENTADLESKMYDLHHTRGELAGMRAVKASREAAELAKLREVKAIQKMNFDEIYASAVKAQKLETADMVEHTIESAAQTTKEQKDAAAERLLHPIPA